MERAIAAPDQNRAEWAAHQGIKISIVVDIRQGDTVRIDGVSVVCRRKGGDAIGVVPLVEKYRNRGTRAPVRDDVEPVVAIDIAEREVVSVVRRRRAVFPRRWEGAGAVAKQYRNVALRAHGREIELAVAVKVPRLDFG